MQEAIGAQIATCFKMHSCLALELEEICSCENSIDFQRTTLHYIPENVLVFFTDILVRTVKLISLPCSVH
jgi:hypothetical protein